MELLGTQYRTVRIGRTERGLVVTHRVDDLFQILWVLGHRVTPHSQSSSPTEAVTN